MKKLFLISVILTVAVLLASCSEDRSLTPADSPGTSMQDVDPELIAAEVAMQSNWPVDEDAIKTPAGCGYILDIEREEIVGDIVHYSYELRIGPGPYDVIGLHRVVKERKPYRPVGTRKCVFLQHGDCVGFEGLCLFGAVAPSAPDDRAIAVYLAENEIDVWGIDQPWVMVPQDETDFSFMADWGLQYHIDNLRIALAVARFTRLITGCGFGKMLLLGYSSGAALGYAYLNDEVQRPMPCRHVSGYIPVDMTYKTDDEPDRLASCATAAENKAMLDAGINQWDVPFVPIAILALTDPDSESPLAPGSGLTNYIVALIAGSATHMLAAMPYEFHYVAGEFNEYGLPTGFQFMTVDNFFDFLMGASFYQPNAFIYEYNSVACDEIDLPFDDYLGEIDVPVFYVGAAGGIGDYGFYATTLLGSSDVTTLNVQLYPSEYRVIDFGHVDLFAAENAEDLVWQPVMEWIEEHSMKEGKCGPKGRKF